MFEVISEYRCFGGIQGFYQHVSSACDGRMRVSVYQPPQAQNRKVPVLYYLAGLTCTEETFMIKSGAQRIAAELGIMLVGPDTSPRNTGIPGEAETWDFGAGAGFYVDSTQEPWSRHYRMYSYVTNELPKLINSQFPALKDRQGIFGHSMGGHGALICALKNPRRYCSVSAFAPVSAPMSCPWGNKAFRNYLGSDREHWRDYDASELVRQRPLATTILIDQGLEDKFIDEQLRPAIFEAACKESGQSLQMRQHPGYDHGYYFIASFIEDHLRHHASQLCARQ